MNEHEINPFQELYVTDSPDPEVFVHLFSDIPVRHAQALFRPGNVVLKGTQGSGKSMLLNLFRPTIRLAYHKAAVKFPVPAKLSCFIGAGINLTRSGALDFGQRSFIGKKDQSFFAFPLYFGDFLNYFIIRDIFESLSIMEKSPDVFHKAVDGKKFDVFTHLLSKQECWLGTLESCKSFEDVILKIDDRIDAYRIFHSTHRSLPDEIHNTTTIIGEPIARTVDCLRDAGVIGKHIPVYVRIDQLERLCRSDIINRQLGIQYRQIVNKAMGARDQRVCYRIGTRRYAWEDDLTIFSTGDQLENLRDYRVIELDDILRRKEDTKTWIFPDFTLDAFSRRLAHSGIAAAIDADLIKDIFGTSPNPEKEAVEIAGSSKAERILKIDQGWPRNWVEFLSELYKIKPLEAMLASAWARQRGTLGKRGDRLKSKPPMNKRPWLRSYWRKERLRQCLMQMAARSPGRLKWYGKEQVISLSGGNITIFLSICHEIWEAFLRSERRRAREHKAEPLRESIEKNVQAVGIYTASAEWYEKITEQPNGHDRQRFVHVLGTEFRRKLLDDLSMSYPGHNGFSLVNEELSKYPNLKQFLEDATAYGDLYSVPHTTKSKDRKARTKWYLSPILSPYFQIPESHVKEPLYASIDSVGKWVESAEIYIDGFDPPMQGSKTSLKKRSRKKIKDTQMSLFKDLG